MIKRLSYFLFAAIIFPLLQCKSDIGIDSKYITKRIIIISVDGPRFQETWGKAGHPFIPYRSSLAEQGVFFSNFSNIGYTLTNPGHTAIATGVNQNIDNGGANLPDNPSIFQYYLSQTGLPNSKCQLITSKDKLNVLGNCSDPAWNNQFMPESDCGKSGPHSGYREDLTTFQHALKTLSQKHPDITFIQFKEPDASGHANNWTAYINGIKNTDYYVGMIWKFIQQDTFYAGKTTLFVSNDHGRHNDGWADGFINHGDNCSGCRHIELLAVGPDFKKNVVVNKAYNQTDILPTIAKMMGFTVPRAKGVEIKELLK